jgi:hypothetical protein
MFMILWIIFRDENYSCCKLLSLGQPFSARSKHNYLTNKLVNNIKKHFQKFNWIFIDGIKRKQ